MKHKYITVGLIVFAICGLITITAIYRKKVMFDCLLPIAESKRYIDDLDQGAKEFESTKSDILGRSTEGGLQVTYTRDGDRKIVEQRFYGETGRTHMRFYYYKKAIFALVKLDTHYKVPLSQDVGAEISTEDEREYFLSRNANICTWYLNGNEQSIDSDTINMVKDYLTGVL